MGDAAVSKWYYLFALAAAGHFLRWVAAGMDDTYLALGMAETALFFIFEGRGSD